MSTVIQSLERAQLRRVPSFQPGDRVKVHFQVIEGTRKRTPHWRSGFYHIALGAQVPIALGFADYQRKVGGIGRVISRGKTRHRVVHIASA